MRAGKDDDLFAFDHKPQQVWKATQHNTPDRAIDFLVDKRCLFKSAQGMTKLIIEGCAKPRLLQLIPSLCLECV